jgi:BirA family biotin operon repressor/biotin-[acetyl-CoA-carboxylase] ligase
MMKTQNLFAPKSLTFSLLRRLADGEFHSGEVLAKQFGVSRASVNNALQGVEKFGLTLFRVRGRGYRLVEPVEWLEAALVRAALKTPQIFNIDIIDCAESTNSMLLQRATKGMSSGNVLAVEWQSAGRGRLGRPWHSGLGNALTFSLLWRFNVGVSALSGLSLAVGVAVMRALKKLNVSGVGLKWPNDVLSENGKLAGILIEAQGDMLGPSAVVIGVGVNLRLPSLIAQRIDQPVSDLARSMDVMPERNRLLALLLQELAEILIEFAEQGFAALREEWEGYHVYQNRAVKMLMPDGAVVVGVVRGINEAGALRVQTDRGVQEFNAGEISLREA